MNDTNDLMTFSLRSLLLIVAITAGIMAQQTPKEGVIRGYVTDNERRPLSDVRLTLRSRGGITTSSQTNASGLFGFTNLPLGSYILIVDAPGYQLDKVPGRFRIGTPDGQGFPVEISSTHVDADVTFSLRRATTMVGSVLDSDDKPAFVASVVLLQRSFNAIGVPQLIPVRPAAIVDVTGQYAIEGVSEGEYFISAKGVGERGHPGVFPTIYYPGTSDVRNAAPIVVGTNATLVTGINIVVNRDDHFSIAGRITVADEDVAFPVPEIHIAPSLDSSDSRMLPNLAEDKSNAFGIQNVGSGVYDLVAVVFRDGVSYTGRTQVEVHSSDVDGVKLVLKRAADLSGKVVSANPEAGVNLSELRVVLTGIHRTPSSLNAFGPSVFSDGSFELKKIPAAEYVLSMSGLPPDHYMESARLDNEDILHRAFPVTHTSRLDIVVNAPGGEITGGLITERGDRLNAVATIVLVPVQRSNNPLNSFKVTRSNDRGEFDLSGIRPGQYHVLAFEPVAASPAYYNEDFLRQYEYRGSPVTIVAGQVIRLDLIPVHARLP